LHFSKANILENVFQKAVLYKYGSGAYKIHEISKTP